MLSDSFRTDEHTCPWDRQGDRVVTEDASAGHIETQLCNQALLGPEAPCGIPDMSRLADASRKSLVDEVCLFYTLLGRERPRKVSMDDATQPLASASAPPLCIAWNVRGNRPHILLSTQQNSIAVGHHCSSCYPS